VSSSLTDIQARLADEKKATLTALVQTRVTAGDLKRLQSFVNSLGADRSAVIRAIVLDALDKAGF